MQRKTVRRVSKVLLTWLVVFMLTLDTASACHPFRYWAGRCRVAQPVYCGPTVVQCYPEACCPTVSPCEAVVSDCCEGAPADMGEAAESTHESMRPLTEPAPPTEVTPADQPPTLSTMDDIPDAPDFPLDTLTAPAEADEPLAPLDSIDIIDPDQEGPSSESSPNDLDRLPDTLPDNALTVPEIEPAAEARPADDLGDLFADPATEEPAAEAQPADDLGDLFADPATEEPATSEQPADDGLGDLFGEPATDEPATPEQPADDGLGDLFGEPATQEPATQEPPADGLNDLFQDDSAEAQEADGSGNLMEDIPAATDSIDDLFGDPADSGASDASDAATPDATDADGFDDLFGDPSADTTQPTSDEFDNMFGATPDGPAAPRVVDGSSDPLNEPSNDPPESQSDESSLDTDLDDLFGQVAPRADRSITASANLVRHAVGLAATAVAYSSPQMPIRSWTDNTGTFHTRGRLVVVGDDYVRLLKENGRYATVPMRRLSQENLTYVQQNAHGLSGQPIAQIAGR